MHNKPLEEYYTKVILYKGFVITSRYLKDDKILDKAAEIVNVLEDFVTDNDIYWRWNLIFQ